MKNILLIALFSILLYTVSGCGKQNQHVSGNIAAPIVNQENTKDTLSYDITLDNYSEKDSTEERFRGIKSDANPDSIWIEHRVVKKPCLAINNNVIRINPENTKREGYTFSKALFIFNNTEDKEAFRQQLSEKNQTLYPSVPVILK